VGGVAVGHQRAVVADDRILVAESRPAQTNAASVHVQEIVEHSRNDVPAVRFEDERLDSVVA
jgi:hypothetical protein